MANSQPTPTSVTIRNSKTGRTVTVRGAGALKGHLILKKNVDLTKPIASQAMKHAKPRVGILPAKT